MTLAPEPTRDARGRALHDLRVSVTDRCNFRCHYCMPREVFGPGFAFLPRAELLTFEEITRAVAAFARLGTRKVRLTGGEPLLRRDLPTLVAELRAVPGIDEIAITTNGALLARLAPALRRAGLDRVTVSLDSLDPEVFRAMSGSSVPVRQVLDGIAAAVAAGFGPIKVNTVVKRGVNEAGLLELAGWAREAGHVLRFIEFMDVGTTNQWRHDEVVPSAEVLARVGAEFPLEPLPPRYPGEVASRFRYTDGGGEVGVISSVTAPFCGQCTRARLTSIGEVYTCLFSARGHDLRALLREGADDAELDAFVAGLWHRRADRYSEERAAGTGPSEHVEMSYVGG